MALIESIPVKISTVHRDDIPALADMAREIFGERAWTLAGFNHFLFESNPTNAIAAWHKDANGDSQIVGFLAYKFEVPTIAVEYFAVRIDSRRGGIASKLFYTLAKAIEIKRFSSIVTTVDEYNVAAQKLLAALGFLATTVTKGRMPNQPDSYTFEFQLPQHSKAAGTR